MKNRFIRVFNSLNDTWLYINTGHIVVVYESTQSILLSGLDNYGSGIIALDEASYNLVLELIKED